jgi:hypothetical protein
MTNSNSRCWPEAADSILHRSPDNLDMSNLVLSTKYDIGCKGLQAGWTMLQLTQIPRCDGAVDIRHRDAQIGGCIEV